MILNAPRQMAPPVAAAPLQAAALPGAVSSLPQAASLVGGCNPYVLQAPPGVAPLRTQAQPSAAFKASPPATGIGLAPPGASPPLQFPTVRTSCKPDRYIEYVYEEFKGPYTQILEFLATQGLLEGLPLQSGVLGVSVPFCASFIECGILSRYLAQNFLGKPTVRGVNVLGTELTTDETYLWDKKEAWVAENFPGMQLQIKQADLAKDPLPPVGLTIGIHPEVTRGAPWDAILANLTRSTPGGLVVTAHFFIEEARAAVQMFADQGVECQVFENQYYRGRYMPPSPWMRFFVIARPGRQGPPLPNHPGALPVDASGDLAYVASQAQPFSQLQRQQIGAPPRPLAPSPMQTQMAAPVQHNLHGYRFA